jgi:hypothetical protein
MKDRQSLLLKNWLATCRKLLGPCRPGSARKRRPYYPQLESLETRTLLTVQASPGVVVGLERVEFT